MKIQVNEKWNYGGIDYNKGDILEMTPERFKALVNDGVKLIEVKEPDYLKKEKIKKSNDD